MSVALGLWKLQISSVCVAVWLLLVIPAYCSAAFPERLLEGFGYSSAL